MAIGDGGGAEGWVIEADAPDHGEGFFVEGVEHSGGGGDVDVFVSNGGAGNDGAVGVELAGEFGGAIGGESSKACR